MADFLLGMNAKIYQGAVVADPSTLDPSTLTEMGNVKDVTLSLEAGEADVTTRANSGWRATAPTLRECSCEFDMIWKPGDAGFEAIKAAFLSAGTVALAVLTGAHNESGAEGPVGNWSITNFSRSEALEEAVTVSVTAKLAAFGQWYEAT
jgi:hypothetical protein